MRCHAREGSGQERERRMDRAAGQDDPIEDSTATPRIAVLIPCHDEAITIFNVVRDFRHSLPQAEIYVYDNNSTDATVAEATRAGAVVRSEKRQGKGRVVCRMFADIEADIYILVDGDGTYDAADAPVLVERLRAERLDMVTGTRVDATKASYRRGHRLGNRVLTGLVAVIFGGGVKDMLSGYRAFSRRFVKSFAALSTGFEIETQMTVHALALCLPLGEVSVRYRERPAGSASKLKTYEDGFRILATIAALVRDERPLAFFLGIAAGLALLSGALGLPVILHFLRTGLVPRLPTAVLAAALAGIACLAAVCGLVLDSVQRGRKEAKRLAYLRMGAR